MIILTTRGDLTTDILSQIFGNPSLYKSKQHIVTSFILPFIAFFFLCSHTSITHVLPLLPRSNPYTSQASQDGEEEEVRSYHQCWFKQHCLQGGL
jgi:hypothetical protein